ncbi:MAG: hypothetical protein ACRDLM_11760 [Gaiellaceae bacterium]
MLERLLTPPEPSIRLWLGAKRLPDGGFPEHAPSDRVVTLSALIVLGRAGRRG